MKLIFKRLSISIILLVLVWSAAADFHEVGLAAAQPVSMEEHQQQHDNIDAMESQRASVERIYNLCNMLKGCDSTLLHQALNRPLRHPNPTPPFRIWEGTINSIWNNVLNYVLVVFSITTTCGCGLVTIRYRYTMAIMFQTDYQRTENIWKSNQYQFLSEVIDQYVL